MSNGMENVDVVMDERLLSVVGHLFEYLKTCVEKWEIINGKGLSALNAIANLEIEVQYTHGTSFDGLLQDGGFGDLHDKLRERLLNKVQVEQKELETSFGKQENIVRHLNEQLELLRDLETSECLVHGPEVLYDSGYVCDTMSLHSMIEMMSQVVEMFNKEVLVKSTILDSVLSDKQHDNELYMVFLSTWLISPFLNSPEIEKMCSMLQEPIQQMTIKG